MSYHSATCPTDCDCDKCSAPTTPAKGGNVKVSYHNPDNPGCLCPTCHDNRHLRYQVSCLTKELRMVTSVKDDAVTELGQVKLALKEMTQAWHSACNAYGEAEERGRELYQELQQETEEAEHTGQALEAVTQELADTKAQLDEERRALLRTARERDAFADSARDYSSRMHEAEDKLAHEKRMSMALAVRCNGHLRGRRRLATAYVAMRRTAQAEHDKRRQADAHCDTLQAALDTATMTHACVSCGELIHYGKTLHVCAPDKGSARNHPDLSDL